MTVLMSRDVSNFQVQVQLFRLLSFTYVESHRDYLTVESTDVVSCNAFSDVRLRRTFVLKQIIFNESPRMQRFQLNMLGLGQLKQSNCMALCLIGKEVKR